jgi:hypothetical protein
VLTNDDLKLIEEVARFLNGLATPRSITLCNKLVKLHNKVVDEKNKRNEKSKKYNKEHKKYHNLINAMYYNRKRGNWARVRELEEEIKNFKNLTSK